MDIEKTEPDILNKIYEEVLSQRIRLDIIESNIRSLRVEVSTAVTVLKSLVERLSIIERHHISDLLTPVPCPDNGGGE